MNRSISAFRVPRALVAVAAALALAAPYAAAFGCIGGDCCGPMHASEQPQHADALSQHMQHHGIPEQAQAAHGSSVVDQSSAPPCPMMMACGTVNVAVVFRAGAAVPFMPVGETGTVSSPDFLGGRILAPLTPPPRV
jgi:hypothetical protein